MSSRDKRTRIIAGRGTLDLQLIISVCFLLMFGFIMVYSAGRANGQTSAMRSQVLYAVIGFAAMLLFSRINYRWLVLNGHWWYILAMLSLTLVLTPMSHSSHGAARWIQIGGVTVQVAELAKPAVIVLLAGLLTANSRKMVKFRYAFGILAVGIVAALMVNGLTSNLSTAVIIAGITLIMFFVAYPTRKVWRWVAALAAAVLLLCYGYYHFVIVPEHQQFVNGMLSGQTVAEDTFPYRDRRILAWLYPDDFTESSMQTRYSLRAISSGGLLGRGLGNGIVKYSLPEPTNDFIFAVIGEELGAVGCLVVIFLFSYNIYQLIRIAIWAPDASGRYIAAGVAAHFSLQAFFNIAVALGLVPNTGISLPFISYGGTALIIQMLEVGIVLNVARQTPAGVKTVVQESRKPGRRLSVLK